LRDKINKLEICVRTRTLETYRGINEFKKGYKPITSWINHEKGDFPYSNILNTWKNYFFQLLKVRGVSDIRQMEIHAVWAF
jgi:hypothetical protein